MLTQVGLRAKSRSLNGSIVRIFPEQWSTHKTTVNFEGEVLDLRKGPNGLVTLKLAHGWTKPLSAPFIIRK